MPDINEELQIKFWLERSKEDLAAAKVMLEASRYTWSIFICQQALEKLLKAGYVHKFKAIPPYIHKLERLAQLLEINFDNQSYLDSIIEIDKYYLVARYPSYKQAVNIKNRGLARELFQKTKEIYKWLKEKLNLK